MSLPDSYNVNDSSTSVITHRIIFSFGFKRSALGNEEGSLISGVNSFTAETTNRAGWLAVLSMAMLVVKLFNYPGSQAETINFAR